MFISICWKVWLVKMDHIFSHKLVSSDAPIDILNMVQKSSENRA
jgi:hypothetical protein